MSPEKVGAEMWGKCPTIRSLIKMVTSGKFKFPTADCDVLERDRVQSEEDKLKDHVSLYCTFFIGFPIKRYTEICTVLLQTRNIKLQNIYSLRESLKLSQKRQCLLSPNRRWGTGHQHDNVKNKKSFYRFSKKEKGHVKWKVSC